MIDDIVASIRQRVIEAGHLVKPLNICGGDSKHFYGGNRVGERLDLTPYNGIVAYDPSELVLTVRAGTRLTDVQAILAEQGQQLGFDPPHFSEHETIGGVVACGFAGPGRPYHGGVRDSVLGVRMINGLGQDLRFGGVVMKNVAGFDVSRLMVGALGTLGILLEVSIRVVPTWQLQRTLLREIVDPYEAIRWFSRTAASPTPLSAACWYNEIARIRFSGSQEGVEQAIAEVEGDIDVGGDAFWQAVRDHNDPFFHQATILCRANVPANAMTEQATHSLIDWGGAQRWFWTESEIENIRHQVATVNGHVCLFRQAQDRSNVFHPLCGSLMQLQKRIKQSFDPVGILNPGRLYPQW